MNVQNPSPLDSLLFFDPSALGGFVVHNLWTWVALFSAALSFFGIRLFPSLASSSSSSVTTFPTSSQPDSPLQSHPFAATRSNSPPPPADDDYSFFSTTTARCVSAASTSDACTESAASADEKTRYRKFTVAYYVDERGNVGGDSDEDTDADDEHNDEDEAVGGVVYGSDEVVRRCGYWGKGDHLRPRGHLEYVMELKMGDFGWYRCQDLGALSGNVVRLWQRNPAIDRGHGY